MGGGVANWVWRNKYLQWETDIFNCRYKVGSNWIGLRWSEAKLRMSSMNN